VTFILTMNILAYESKRLCLYSLYTKNSSVHVTEYLTVKGWAYFILLSDFVSSLFLIERRSVIALSFWKTDSQVCNSSCWSLTPFVCWFFWIKDSPVKAYWSLSILLTLTEWNRRDFRQWDLTATNRDMWKGISQELLGLHLYFKIRIRQYVWIWDWISTMGSLKALQDWCRNQC